MAYRSSRETRAECRDAGREYGRELADLFVASMPGLRTDEAFDAAAVIVVSAIARWLAVFADAGVTERDLHILKEAAGAAHNERIAEELARIRLAEAERPAILN